MKAADLRTLRALLTAGDAPGALAYLDGLKATPAKATRTAAPKPMPRPGPLGWRKRFPAILPPPLAVAPCRCTIYRDGGVMCPEHEAARDLGPCAALIEQEHAAGRLPHAWAIGHPATFVFQAACRYEGCAL